MNYYKEKRLIFIDEVNDINEEELSKLTDIHSKGIEDSAKEKKLKGKFSE